VIGGRHRFSTNINYTSSVQMLDRFAALSGCSVAALCARPTTPPARLALAVEAERVFMRWAIYLVLHKGTVNPESAYQYIKNVRSVVNDHCGFEMTSVHKFRNLAALIDGLKKLKPVQRRQRDPILQQHILAWATRLDHTLHTHRTFLARTVTLFMTASRFGDISPSTAGLFNPATHVTIADVQLFPDRACGCGFITIKTTKMERQCTWEPKPLPIPDVHFPLTVGPETYPTLSALITCTNSALPAAVMLSPWFQLARLLALRPASSKTTPDAQTPLFHTVNGRSVCLQHYNKDLKAVAEACGHSQFLSAHSNRIGGETAAEATGVASQHALQAMGYWRSHNSVLLYNQSTVSTVAPVMRAMAAVVRTDTALDHAFTVREQTVEVTVPSGLRAGETFQFRYLHKLYDCAVPPGQQGGDRVSFTVVG
jgi:hypothetical protein